MKTVNINQVDYQVFDRSEHEAIVKAYREDRPMLVERHCVVCNDPVIGEVDAENSPNWECRCMACDVRDKDGNYLV